MRLIVTVSQEQPTSFFTRVIHGGLSLLLWLIPGPRGLRLFGGMLGGLLFLAPSWRRVARQNIRLIFADRLGPAQRRSLLWQVYLNLGTTLLEMFWDCDRHGLPVDQWVALEGLENLEAARSQGHGVIVATAHLGNWALLIRRLAAQGYLCRSLMRPPSMPGANRYIEQQVPWMKLEYIPTPLGRKSLSLCLQTLRDGDLLLIVADRRSQDVKVDFLGQPAWTATGAATFHLRSGAPIVPAFIIRQGNRHLVRCEKPIVYQATGDRKADELEITRRLNQVISGWVTRFPEQWLWVHNRWKDKKGG